MLLATQETLEAEFLPVCGFFSPVGVLGKVLNEISFLNLLSKSILKRGQNK